VTHGPSLLGQVFKLRPRAAIESLDHADGTGCRSRVLSQWSSFGPLVFAHWLDAIACGVWSPPWPRRPQLALPSP
jgi:hypothetical protein